MYGVHEGAFFKVIVLQKIRIFAGYHLNVFVVGVLNNHVSERERAAIYLHVFGGVNDWRLLYAIANTGDGSIIESDVKNKYFSKWHSSLKIKQLIKDTERVKFALLSDVENAAFEKGKRAAFDSVSSSGEQTKRRAAIVDYTDPREQARKLNELVNTATDPGEALDALKVIMQTQKADRDAAREQKVVRAYVPLACAECPLYQRALSKGQKSVTK